VREVDKLDTLVVHHSASRRSATLEDIRDWHLDRGWSDVGYHYVIEESGERRLGRPLGRIGAHCRGHNSYTVGVCVTGDNTQPGEAWNEAQIESLKELAGEYTIVHGHRDLAATECPGVDIKDLLKEA
jgi:N-acetylmuramoyl-L-alanine amidase